MILLSTAFFPYHSLSHSSDSITWVRVTDSLILLFFLVDLKKKGSLFEFILQIIPEEVLYLMAKEDLVRTGNLIDHLGFQKIMTLYSRTSFLFTPLTQSQLSSKATAGFWPTHLIHSFVIVEEPGFESLDRKSQESFWDLCWTPSCPVEGRVSTHFKVALDTHSSSKYFMILRAWTPRSLDCTRKCFQDCILWHALKFKCEKQF